MGNNKRHQIITVIVLLAVACIPVYWPEPAEDHQNVYSLREALIQPGDYVVEQQMGLSDVIVDTLELDDYVQNRYLKVGGRDVELYIGYYYSLAKLSAAHSPLVCFPGQGWEVSDTSANTIEVGGSCVNYVEMTASIQDHKTLVMYWFQAADKTATQIYRNKINALLNKLTGKDHGHAFVRVSISMTKDDIEAARTAGRDFIRQFYPDFLEYIKRIR